jgi:serine/threonine protein kinase
VADFGLSREDVVSRTSTSLRGTFGYLDPEYVSSRNFTKKSDVYSYGILLFELIAGRNPQQGLMEYVELVSFFIIHINRGYLHLHIGHRRHLEVHFHVTFM